MNNLSILFATFVLGLHMCGVAAAIHALMSSRTSQGAIAWVVSLLTFPYLTLPLYVLLGRNRFQGYFERLRDARERHASVADKVRQAFAVHGYRAKGDAPSVVSGFESLTDFPMTVGNSAELLIDGEAAFTSIFESIERAKDYILVQFYIVRDDGLCKELQQRLIERARAGVRVHLLYDALGSFWLPASFSASLREAGVKVSPFAANRFSYLPFQLNFRNHRKIVVADGRVAFVGGHNVGDEYLGKSRKFGSWRDTHMRIEGPAVKTIQAAFASDWCWATGEVLELDWEVTASPHGNLPMLTVPTGPADEIERCSLFFLQAISAARKRLWIASPYFVPSATIIDALHLAALRGVDVRIVVPENPDHLLVYLAGLSYLSAAEESGLQILRYTEGFLHQKVFVADDEIACIGTANLDNRSLRLNFEISIIVNDRDFCSSVSEMLERDFARCRKIGSDELSSRSFPFKVAVRLARLFSPIL